jgi:hypothetical protein
MEIVETKLKKLIASEGKVIVPKEIQYDEEGNEIPRDGAKTIYLAINDNENNYEEIEDVQ